MQSHYLSEAVLTDPVLFGLSMHADGGCSPDGRTTRPGGRRCRCGVDVAEPRRSYGCLTCGDACCTACAIVLESVAYCRRCAVALLEAAAVPAGFDLR